MSAAYETISYFWNNYPTELVETNIYPEMIGLKKEFEEKQVLFTDYLVKIVVIGEVSSGKSTLVNALLDKEIFSMSAIHGTPSFFYVSQNKKSNDYFTINDGNEVDKLLFIIDDISILIDVMKLRNNMPNFIDENSVVKVFIKDENIQLLKRKTVIVDCPGMGQDQFYEEQIKYHCINADIFIFMFDINKPATQRQKSFVKRIRENFKSPSCFFIYNKCDTVEFDEEVMLNMRESFYDTFEEQYVRNLRIGGEPLYFISAEKELKKLILHTENNYNILCKEEFNRFIADLLKHKNVSFLRIQNILGSLSRYVINYQQCIKETITIEIKTKIQKTKEKQLIETRKESIEKLLPTIKDSFSEIKETIKKELDLDDILNYAIEIIENYNGKCDQTTAKPMILTIAEEFNDKISEQLRIHLNKYWYDRLINELEDKMMNKKFNKNKFQITSRWKIMPTDVDLNIFWWFESGDKTEKVRNVYLNYMKKNLSRIRSSVNSLIDKQIKNNIIIIETELKKMINDEKDKINEKSKIIDYKEELIKILNDYEGKCKQAFHKYNSLLN